MLPKRSRLSAEEVRAILKDGRPLRSGSLTAKYLSGASRKAAVVVKRATSGSAVARNRLRREAYAALERLLPDRIRLVLFIQKPPFNPSELADLCSKLS